MYNPLVSIVIPLYNGSNYVAQAIDCALAQTYSNIEIIVVNDGSRDEGAGERICLSYGDKIRYFSKENGGCSSAINYGIRQAKGAFISWLSHDDLYDPDKVQVQIELYEKLGLDKNNTMISHAGRIIDENGKERFHPNRTKNKLLTPTEAFAHLLFGTGFNGCGLMIPKALFDQGLCFREDMRFVLDWNLWQKMVIRGAEVYSSKEILVSNRQHSQQVTVKQSDRYLPELEMSCEEIFALLKGHNNPVFMQLLYYYCNATDKKITNEIKGYMKENRIGIDPFKVIKYSFKKRSLKAARRVYYLLRRR